MTKEELDRLDSEGLNPLFYKRLFAEQKAYNAWLQTLFPKDMKRCSRKGCVWVLHRGTRHTRHSNQVKTGELSKKVK